MHVLIDFKTAAVARYEAHASSCQMSQELSRLSCKQQHVHYVGQTDGPDGPVPRHTGANVCHARIIRADAPFSG